MIVKRFLVEKGYYLLAAQAEEGSGYTEVMSPFIALAAEYLMNEYKGMECRMAIPTNYGRDHSMGIFDKEKIIVSISITINSR